jgi:predicted ATP-grasp superfamily ATP-dependent carboligase
MHALVTDANLRTAVAGIRALGRAGVRTLAVGPTRFAAGLCSRYAAGRSVAPGAAEDPEAFAAELVRLAERHGPLVLYACQEASLDVAMDVAARVPAARLPYGDSDAVRLVRDKSKLPALAAAAGIGTPITYFEGTARELDPALLTFPCVAKPLVSTGLMPHPRRLESREAAQLLRDTLPPDQRLLIQALADGKLRALTLLVTVDGRVVARFEQEALRTWPQSAGPSALAVSVAPDEELTERSRRLLAGAGYSGLAELQFVHSEDGPLLIDINTRLYGSLPLALRAGVNLPALWHRMASGEVPAAADPPPYRAGVSFRWLEADVSAALRGEPRILLARGPRPRSGAMWATDDPIAAALLAADAIRVRARRRIRGGRDH